MRGTSRTLPLGLLLTVLSSVAAGAPARAGDRILAVRATEFHVDDAGRIREIEQAMDDRERSMQAEAERRSRELIASSNATSAQKGTLPEIDLAQSNEVVAALRAESASGRETDLRDPKAVLELLEWMTRSTPAEREHDRRFWSATRGLEPMLAIECTVEEGRAASVRL